MGTPSSNVFRKWLWNFPETENLNFYSIAVKGSILAPHATFNATGSGNIDGTVILNNFYNYNSGFEVHNYTFIGSVPDNNINPTPDENTPSEEKPDVTTPEVPTPEVPKEDVTVPEETLPETSDTSKDTESIIEEGTLGVTDIKKDTENTKIEETSSTINKGPKTGDYINSAATIAVIIASSIALIFLRKIK